MGIPSYYKRLVDRFPALVLKGNAASGLLGGGSGGGATPSVLCMDFNCLIYQCVRADSLPVYSHDKREAWEAALLEAVKRYTVHVWDVAGRPREVFLAVDGVVPMAKIRQQRLRRFKSLWWAAAEREAGVREAETWDTNAITPGTAFMDALGVALRSLCAARQGWRVSGADEPGEGEQKIMAWLRQMGTGGLAGKRIVVYGLDADLIVLSLLSLTGPAAAAASMHLLRELAEFEGGRGTDGAAGFGLLDVRGLLDILVPPGLGAAEYMLEYACAMSFLGNDFLPHSLSITMREGGHDEMCRTLTALHTGGGRLVGAGGCVSAAGCAAFLAGWAEKEEEWLARSIAHKYKGRGPPPRNEKERAMVGVQNLPLEWKEEAWIWSAPAEGGGGLKDDWRKMYKARWLRGAEAEQTCGEYMQGLQWILDYYSGRPVSYAWYYPWNLPPLWSDLVGALGRVGANGIKAPPVSAPVAPQEQLAMVLPMGSWGLVREPKLRGLPARAPVYWPEHFGFFSAGKRWMWECEAEVPILTAERLRQLV